MLSLLGVRLFSKIHMNYKSEYATTYKLKTPGIPLTIMNDCHTNSTQM